MFPRPIRLKKLSAEERCSLTCTEVLKIFIINMFILFQFKPGDPEKLPLPKRNRKAPRKEARKISDVKNVCIDI